MLVLDEEHYIDRNAAGQLVISNKSPPARSEVLKQLHLTDGKQPGEDRDTLVKNTKRRRSRPGVSNCPAVSTRKLAGGLHT
jgi:hypothetical protein